ncbi:rhodanese-like domain-containing protein [Nesterenkonia flava]|uniref:Rhodanese-like domain-containing protein n=1 Tax=Nesterenkonia flava TaxID=469799 RepID=A0ABU1FTL1_9MICC|nr:rhodanese-like domain-containing protein [Nesterenkonia flava]MDR5712000.1 rhodanese-like domain-containing protein [Nesterenkonia flava]
MTVTYCAPEDLLQGDPSAPQVLIDVRTPAEFEAAHIKGSRNLPLDLLQKNPSAVASSLPEEVMLLCQSGARSQQAAQALSQAGTDRLHMLNGGINAYVQAGGELMRGTQRWEMERQVRMGAGVLVATGILASHFVSPKLKWLSFGVGSGLIFAAATNTCGMSYALSRMPWNRTAADPTLESALRDIPDITGTL